MTAYYNEFDPYAAQWLRELIAAGHIAPGEVDERSIVDVHADDLKGFTQCHFFAGIGGWSLAARLSGFPDDRELWTGSCPCQPFSVAGKGEAQADERHLWPVFFDLIRARRPAVVMGEQVAAAVGKDWLDGVHSDLEGIGYTCGAAVVPACAVDAPHRRDRLWFVADANSFRGSAGISGPQPRQERVSGEPYDGRREVVVADTNELGEGEGREQRGGQLRRTGRDQSRSSRSLPDTARASKSHQREQPKSEDQEGNTFVGSIRAGAGGRSLIGHNSERGSLEIRGGSAWAGAEWAIGADGKARRVEPGVRLLAYGVPARVGKLRAYGNAIVPQVAAEVIGAYLDMEREAA